MKKEKAVNMEFVVAVLLSIVMLAIDYRLCISDRFEVTGIFRIVAVTFPFVILVGFLTTPCYYSFSDEGISICYLFWRKERYLWDNIDDIELTRITNTRGPRYKIFRIHGKAEGRLKLFHKGYLCRTAKTERLIEKYWR